MMPPLWFMVWHEIKEGDHIAYMSTERMAECGGVDRDTSTKTNNHQFWPLVVNGIAVLSRWCRINCTTIPHPVNVRGKTGFAFTNSSDALLFKLTWGGK